MGQTLRATRGWLLVLCHFVGPLLFFTNLTRNPYITQIALIFGGLALALSCWAGEEALSPNGWNIPRLPPALPLALFAACWGLSWLITFAQLPPFFHPAIISEGARQGLFILVAGFGSFLLGAIVAAEDDGSSDVSLPGWVVFALAWGGLWTAFSQVRSPVAAPPDQFGPLLWDPYGGLVWALGIAGAGYLTRRRRVADFQHLALCTAFLASAYGVLQYFNLECVWPYTLNPYGGRAVSTFGNPNFLSTFDAALMPTALALFAAEKSTGRRLVYAAVFLTLEAALLATLTRSSWLGAAAGCAVLFAFPFSRKQFVASPRGFGLLAGVAAAAALAWPSSSMATGYTPTVLGRLSEFSEMMHRDGAYSPFHQRVLIWTCAWLMGSESPLWGKGGGLFELFYPFYQGHLLHHFTFFHTMRTHANNAHNEIMELFSQTGLLGLGAMVAAWASFVVAVKRWSRGRAGQDPLWLGAAAGCGAVLIDNMLNVSMHFTVPAFMFWWCAGIVMGRGAREGGGRWTWRGFASGRKWAAGAAMAAALGVCWVQARIWQREAWYFAGFKLVRMGNLPGAQRALERSQSWGPREVNALYELGNTYAREGRSNDAADAYRNALQANAGYDEIFFNLSTVEGVKLAHPGRALTLLETAWAINPLSRDVFTSLAGTLLNGPVPDPAFAADVLAEAVRDNPGEPGLWNSYGRALSMNGRWVDAENALARALSLAPDSRDIAANLAAVAASSGRPRSPILGVASDLLRLEKALAGHDASDATLSLAASVAGRAPNIPKARFYYGSLLLARQKAAEAVVELEAAVQQDPSRSSARLNLGTAYLSLGRRLDAARQFQSVLAVEPGNAVAAERLRAAGVINQ